MQDIFEKIESEEKLLYSYGIGIDCHSKFYQVCVIIRDKISEMSALRFEMTVETSPNAVINSKLEVIKK